ncbi:MAG: hypothetical protein V1838_03645 [Patescibacteria group bacterium]
MPDEYPSSAPLSQGDVRGPRPGRSSRYGRIVVMVIALIIIALLVWWFMRDNDGNQNTNTVNANASVINTEGQNENVNWTIEMPAAPEMTNAPLPVLEIEESPPTQ